ncbi:hypothetical protein [Microcoleus sp. PH2017_28_MFU_U_A]|uniref:hypothetical protein n=1 Tax=Microcoleus sp. PH2017_28_MFU_U_A TaxID=2798838 RepID=UPI001DC549E3|nr:hypothetical protein [Microcoleus sp. PH2017_28_MFU_U_A]MCC3593850.1 hypothetical protein [Microcoleus sp. PH2017_28_MFU_U_A]
MNAVPNSHFSEQKSNQKMRAEYVEMTLKINCIKGTSDAEILNLFSAAEPKELAQMYLWPALRLMWKLRAKEFAGCEDSSKLKECARWMRRELRELECSASDYLEEPPPTSISAGDYKQLALSCFDVLKRTVGCSILDDGVTGISAGEAAGKEPLIEEQISEEESRRLALKALQDLSDSF